MREYLRSARFACGSLTLLIGLSFLIGALMMASYDAVDDRYYLTVGAALCLAGLTLALLSRIGFILYGVVTAAAIGWTLYKFGLDLWQLAPHLFALLLWGGILLALRDRIVPRRRPVGPRVRTGPPPTSTRAKGRS